jgi:polyisoprenoid-binding protein YceI
MKALKIIKIFLLLSICHSVSAQKYISNEGVISFFSATPLEDISAINKSVGAVYDLKSNELVFQLQIDDFIFPKPLMQEHFNENYLESDIFPRSLFVGKLIQNKNGKAIVVGDLSIHGKTNRIEVEGSLIQKDNKVIISSDFIVKLEDYNIAIPKIVMYKIAEEIEIKVEIELEEIK